MPTTTIADVYERLFELRLCRSRSHFSIEWSGREKSYYRSVIARQGTISISANTHLVGTLRSVGISFSQSNFEQVAQKGRALLQLHSDCLEALFLRAFIEAYRV